MLYSRVGHLRHFGNFGNFGIFGLTIILGMGCSKDAPAPSRDAPAVPKAAAETPGTTETTGTTGTTAAATPKPDAAPAATRATHPAVTARPSVSTDANSYVDEDFRFRLQRPSSQWRILDETTAITLTPDSLAGLQKLPAVNMVVSIEFTGEMKLAEIAQILNEGATQTGLAVSEEGPVEGRPAGRSEYRTLMGGISAGVETRMFRRLISRDGWTWTAMAWGSAKLADAASLKAAAAALTVLGGPVTPRQPPPGPASSQGVGWQVRGGVFRSALVGLDVRPSAPWRLQVGSSLRTMDPEADVGLVTAWPDIYASVTVLPVHHHGDDGDDGDDGHHGDHDSGHGGAPPDHPDDGGIGHDGDAYTRGMAEDGPEIPLTRPAGWTGAEPVMAKPWRDPGPPTVKHWLIYGSLAGKQTRIAVWAAPEDAAVVESRLQGLIDSIGPTDTQLLTSLREASRRDRSQLNAIGESFALRDGIYQSFAKGVLWRAPEGIIWRLFPGPESVELAAPVLGFNGIIQLWPAGPGRHENIEEAMVSDGLKIQARGVFDGIDGRWFMGTPGPGVPTVAVASIVTDFGSAEIQLWGAPSAHKANPTLLRRVAGGLTFVRVGPAGLEPQTLTASSVIDRRLGMAMSLPGDRPWSSEARTPAGYEAVASQYQWRADEIEVQLLAACIIEPGDDVPARAAMLSTLGLAAFGFDPQATPLPAPKPATLAGQAATVRSWSVAGRTVSIWTMVKGRTIYRLAIAAPQTLEAYRVEEIRRRLHLIDLPAP